MEMSKKTEKLIVHLLHSISDFRDLSISWVANDVFREIAKCLKGIANVEVTPKEVAEKVRTLVEGYTNFIWFLTKPGIIYLAEHNMVVTHSLYHTRCAQTETAEHIAFRNAGFRHYAEMKDLIKDKGLERVDFDWVINQTETNQKKWVGKPSEKFDW